jgi:hypothetical protein
MELILSVIVLVLLFGGGGYWPQTRSLVIPEMERPPMTAPLGI